jgi:hypothetical protein
LGREVTTKIRPNDWDGVRLSNDKPIERAFSQLIANQTKLPGTIQRMAVLPQLHLFFWTLASLWTTSHIAVAQNTTNNNNNGNTTNGTTTPAEETDPTAPTTTTAEPSCYTTFLDVVTAMRAKNPFDFRTYVVCPGTVITIGTEVEEEKGLFTGGDAILHMRQFSRVYCGADGSSANNCTVRGGKSQLKVTIPGFAYEDKQRMEVKGFTFEDADEYNVFAPYADGDLLIEDCIFRYNGNGPILFSAVNLPSPPQITFRRCVFDQNQMGKLPTLFHIEGMALTITDSVFSDNNFYSDTVVRSFSTVFFGGWRAVIVSLHQQSSTGVSSSSFLIAHIFGSRSHFLSFPLLLWHTRTAHLRAHTYNADIPLRTHNSSPPMC